MITCAVGAIRSLWQAGQRDLPVSVKVDASLRMPPGDREVHGAGPSCGSMSRSCTAGSDRGPGLRCCRQRRAPRPEDRCSGTAGRWMPKGRSGPGWRRTGRTGRSCIILRLAPTSERDGPWSTPLGGQRRAAPPRLPHTVLPGGGARHMDQVRVRAGHGPSCSSRSAICVSGSFAQSRTAHRLPAATHSAISVPAANGRSGGASTVRR